MREIKFRAWLKEEKKMVNVNLLDCKFNSIGYIDNDDDFDCYFFENDELMQFTGLCDKNETPIYESDIVDIGFKTFVKYSEEECAFKLFRPNDKYNNSFCLTDFIAERVEVLGNIYENADLLEEVE